MEVKIGHVRISNGWDITIDVKADKDNETIAHVKINVNGFTEDDRDVNPPAKGYQNTLNQKGVYPGDNEVLVTVTDGEGNSNNWVSRWHA
jgi:hypothetical protein